MILLKAIHILQFLVLLLCAQEDDFGMSRDAMMDMGLDGAGPERAKPNKKWKPYMKCETCKEVVKQLLRQSSKLREEIKPKILGEERILNLTETVCDPLDDAGIWTNHIDVVKEKGEIVFKDMKQFGKCKRECETIADICDDIMREFDMEISALIYKNTHKRAKLQQLVCFDGGFCSKKKKKIPAKNTVGKEKWAKGDKNTWDMMKLKSKVPGMSMYNRDDMMNAYEREMGNMMGMDGMGGMEGMDGMFGGDEKPEAEIDDSFLGRTKQAVSDGIGFVKDAWSNVYKAVTGNKGEL